jgi:uncharacterized protein involved in exopolysaccharide biosynthesis
MNQTNQTNVAPSVPDDEVNLLDYWRVIWKRRILIGGLFVAAVLTALVVSLLMPKIYESKVTMLPPLDSGETGGGMAAAAAALGVGAVALPGMPATPVDLYVAMLRSRTLAEGITKQFDLVNVYGTKLEEDAVRILGGNTKISTTKEKVIQIVVEAQDPQLAADLANAYVSGLDQLNRRLAVTKAGQTRLFVEKRLAETKADLSQAEEALSDFQTRNKTMALDQQASAALKAAAEIQGQISATEVQLEVIKNYSTPANPDMVKLTLQLAELKQQLNLIEHGKGGKGMLPGDRLHPAFVTVPSLGVDYARLLRDLKIQETVYTMLVSQYEQAQLAEARDTSTVQVLDPAKPATRKSKPSIRLNMMIAGVVALFAGIFLAFFLEYLERLRTQRNAQMLQSEA